MTLTSASKAKTEPLRSIIFLGVVILVRALGQTILYTRGFLSVSADEYSRGIIAARWASHPSFDLFESTLAAWLPLEKYLNGLTLIVWPDVVLAPRVTVFISSCVVLICLYLLTRQLFSSFWVAALAIIFVGFQPWVVWLSGTPMLEMYYLAFFMGGLLFLLVWLKDARRELWVLAGLSFMVSSGFHVQSWYLINLVNLLTIGFLIGFIRRRQFERLWRLIGYYFLSNALIIAFVAIDYAHNGTVLGFLSNHTNYSLWFYGGYEVSLLEKLLFYPKLLIENISAAIWGLVIVGLLFIRKEQDRGWKLFLLALSFSTLALSSIGNVLSGPPSAAPPRYSLFHTLMLAPYIALGTYGLFMWARQRPSVLARYGMAFLSVALFAYSVFWGAARAVDHPGGPLNAVQAGRHLNMLLEQSDSAENSTYMLELAYWDYLAVQLTAAHYEDTRFDRARDIRDRNTPSIFEKEPAEFYDDLLAQDVRFIVLVDQDLKEQVQQAQFMSIERQVGNWTIYRFQP